MKKPIIKVGKFIVLEVIRYTEFRVYLKGETLMTKKELVKAAIRGEKLKSIPYAIWSHMPDVDRDVPAIVQRTYDFYKAYDVDIVKTMNNGMYSVEDFGCEIDFSDVAKGGVAKVISTPIKCADDWLTIKEVSIEKGALKRELTYLHDLLERLKGEEVPVVFTVFSPMTTANKLCGGKVLDYIAQGYGPQIHEALKEITKTTVKLVECAIELGADGIFLASQMSSYQICDESCYKEFGAPYDTQLIMASKGWCNILHSHGTNIMFDILKDYPVQIFNWHAWETLPSVEEVSCFVGKTIMGGIDRMDITNGHKNEVRHQIYETIKQTHGRNLILSPGCVIRHPLNTEMLSFVKKAKDEVEKIVLA